MQLYNLVTFLLLCASNPVQGRIYPRTNNPSSLHPASGKPPIAHNRQSQSPSSGRGRTYTSAEPTISDATSGAKRKAPEALSQRLQRIASARGPEIERADTGPQGSTAGGRPPSGAQSIRPIGRGIPAVRRGGAASFQGAGAAAGRGQPPFPHHARPITPIQMDLGAMAANMGVTLKRNRDQPIASSQISDPDVAQAAALVEMSRGGGNAQLSHGEVSDAVWQKNNKKGP